MQICRKINIIESTVQREMMQEFFLQLIRVLLGRLRDIQSIKCQQKNLFFKKTILWAESNTYVDAIDWSKLLMFASTKVQTGKYSGP